jgi:hypothetical protein
MIAMLDTSEDLAVCEEEIGLPVELGLTLFICGSTYDPAKIAAAIKALEAIK